MHLFYYLISNPRYEVTEQASLRPFSSEVFYNLKCMLLDSMKHRDIRLDFAYALESGERRVKKRFEQKRDELFMLFINAALFSHCASCCVPIVKSMNEHFSRYFNLSFIWEMIILFILKSFRIINIQMWFSTFFCLLLNVFTNGFIMLTDAETRLGNIASICIRFWPMKPEHFCRKRVAKTNQKTR